MAAGYAEIVYEALSGTGLDGYIPKELPVRRLYVFSITNGIRGNFEPMGGIFNGNESEVPKQL